MTTQIHTTMPAPRSRLGPLALRCAVLLLLAIPPAIATLLLTPRPADGQVALGDEGPVSDGAGSGGAASGGAVSDAVAEPSDTVPRFRGPRLALEFSPVMVPVGFYGFRLVGGLSRDGNLMVGYMYQAFTNDWGQSDAHTLLVGYQHFLWRGLHAEAELWPAYNRWRSSVDDVVYPGFEVWGEARIGYRVDVSTFGRRWYVLPQVLFGTGIWREASPPGPENGTFIFPVLWVGVPLR